MQQIQPEPNPKVEPHIRQAVKAVLAKKLQGPELVDALTEQLTQTYAELWIADFVSVVGNALTDMPEAERKAKMFDMLMSIKAFEKR